MTGDITKKVLWKLDTIVTGVSIQNQKQVNEITKEVGQIGAMVQMLEGHFSVTLEDLQALSQDSRINLLSIMDEIKDNRLLAEKEKQK